MLLIFLLLSVLTGLTFFAFAVALFITVYFGENNGLSWAMAFVVLETGLGFIGLPLTLIFEQLLPVGIAAFLHLWLTFGYFGYRLWTSHNG